MRVATVCFYFVLAFQLSAAKFPLIPDNTLVPAATGEVNVDKDKNGNDRINVHVDHLARPINLSPERQLYIVWVQPSGAPPQKIGQLKVDNSLKGELKTVIPLHNFDLFVTAEDNPAVAEPAGPVVLRTTVRD